MTEPRLRVVAYVTRGEGDETLVDALARELAEETGIRARVIGELGRLL